MKAFSLLMILTLSSCITVTHISSSGKLTGIDFRKYTSEGFLITPEKFSGKYESIGLVCYAIFPESNFDVVSQQWVSKKISLSQGVDSLYYESKAMGANAIMNFVSVQKTQSFPAGMKSVPLVGYEISGFAIKRLE